MRLNNSAILLAHLPLQGYEGAGADIAVSVQKVHRGRVTSITGTQRDKLAHSQQGLFGVT